MLPLRPQPRRCTKLHRRAANYVFFFSFFFNLLERYKIYGNRSSLFTPKFLFHYEALEGKREERLNPLTYPLTYFLRAVTGERWVRRNLEGGTCLHLDL